MDEESRKKLFVSKDPKILKIINEDLLTVISVGQSVQDIMEGDPVPDGMLSVEDVAVLWAYVPEGRRGEFALHFRRFLGSIKDPPSDYNGWQRMHRDAAFNSFESHLSILMMASLAVSFREWLMVNVLSEERQIILKRIAAANMRQIMDGEGERTVAKRKYDEAFR